MNESQIEATEIIEEGLLKIIEMCPERPYLTKSMIVTYFNALLERE
jgi:hypothetical protein